MPRQSPFQGEESEQPILQPGRGSAGGRGRNRAVESADPRQATPDGHNIVPAAQSDEQRTASDRYTAYARNLITENGDIPKAIALTLGISEEEALSDIVRHHEFIRSGARTFSAVSDILERNDATLPIRIAVLSDLMIRGTPAAKAVAVKELNEMDETAQAQRIGTTWEEAVRAARKRVNEKLKRAKR